VQRWQGHARQNVFRNAISARLSASDSGSSPGCHWVPK
jgi:hypothetical protein